MIHMAITLDEALTLLEEKKQVLKNLHKLRKDSAVIVFQEGDSDEFKNTPERQVSEITEEINFVSKQIRKLQRAITKSNVEIETDIQLDGEKLTLGELIVAVRQLREELPMLTMLGNHKKDKKRNREREYASNGQVVTIEKIMITDVLYNTAEYREKAKQSEALIKKMQSTINKINVETTVEYEDVEYSA